MLSPEVRRSLVHRLARSRSQGDGSVRIWDATTGEPVHQLSGHTGGVRSVAYSPDGTHIATGSSGGSVRIWDPHTGTPVTATVFVLPGGEVAVFDAATHALTGATSGAWRWLGWTVVKDGSMTRLPAETFGELPPLLPAGASQPGAPSV